MLQISKVVSKAEAMFHDFNQHFYGGELTTPAITISPDGGHGAYGWTSVHQIWRAGEDKYYEINVCAEYLDRPIVEVARTMLHEMAHLYNIIHEIQDVSNNGYYHNKKFKATAEAHGLVIEQDPKYGWTLGTLTPEAEAWVLDTFGADSLDVSRQKEAPTGKANKRGSINRSRKYVCPCCGTSIRATKEVHVICGDCDEDMTLA